MDPVYFKAAFETHTNQIPVDICLLLEKLRNANEITGNQALLSQREGRAVMCSVHVSGECGAGEGQGSGIWVQDGWSEVIYMGY